MVDFVAAKGGANPALDAIAVDQHGVLHNRVDFSQYPLVNSTGDRLKLFHIPEGFEVRRVTAKVETAEGGAVTATVGTDANADGYIVSVDCNAEGFTADSGDVVETDIGVILEDDDGVWFTPGADMDTAVILFTAEVINHNFSETLI